MAYIGAYRRRVKDWQIAACAARISARYGDLGGSVHAAKRAEILLAAGNFEGWRTWTDIRACIVKLAGLERDDETLH